MLSEVVVVMVEDVVSERQGVGGDRKYTCIQRSKDTFGSQFSPTVATRVQTQVLTIL